VSPPAGTNHNASGHPNLLLLCEGDGSTVRQEGFRAKVMSQSDSQQPPTITNQPNGYILADTNRQARRQLKELCSNTLVVLHPLLTKQSLARLHMV